MVFIYSVLIVAWELFAHMRGPFCLLPYDTMLGCD